MKTINKARLIIITLAMLLVGTFSLSAQGYGQRYGTVDDADYMYIDASFDANKAFGLKDNPRTQDDTRGLDWKFEAGARENNFAIYIFGGHYAPIDYIVYGAGVDYYLKKKPQGLDLSAGIYYSQVIRIDSDGHSGSFTAWVSPRARATYWIGNFGINITGRGQGRYDIGKTVWEGSIGLTFKSNR